MKSNYILAIILFISIALVLGWFYDKKIPESSKNSLQVPDNIDYYLSNLKYRSMNPQGSTHYLLNSPYLEHYIQQDISHLKQPKMQFFGDKSDWSIQAEIGRLNHQEENFELEQQVKLTKSSQQSMLLTTHLMILKAQQNLIEIPQHMNVSGDNVELQAASAILNIDQNKFQFKRVKATYQPESHDGSSNEQS